MKKIFIFFFLLIIFIFIFPSSIKSIDTYFNNVKSPIFAPDTATNIQLYNFSYYYPVNSPILLFGMARCGGNDRDTLYTGTAQINIYEENNDSSAFTFSINYLDTSDYISTTNGQFLFYIENSDTELIGFELTDSSNNIKSSFLNIIKFKEKADTVTHLGGFDDTLFTSEFSLSFFLQFLDDNNNIFFDYASQFQDSTIRIVILDNNNSVTITNFDRSSNDTLYPMFLNGGYYLEINDSEYEDFYIIYEPLLTTYPMDPETIHFVCLPPEEAPTFMVYSADGLDKTIGHDNGLLLLNLGSAGPVSSNNSSQVKCDLYDLTGNGGSINNSSWQTLSDGYAQTIVSSNTANECLILKTITAGTPDLYNITPFLGFKYKNTGEGVIGKVFGQRVASVGDTVDYLINIMDNNYNLDSNYKGFGLIDVYGNLNVLNISNRAWDNQPAILNGYGAFYLTCDTEDTTEAYFKDAEGNFVYNYYATNGFEGQKIQTIWLPPTTNLADTIKLFLPENKTVTVNTKENITIALMSNDSICRNELGDVYVSLTGSAVCDQGDSVYIVNGVGIFNISDTIEETVIINVNGLGSSGEDTIHFINSSTASFAALAGEDNTVVKDTITWTIYALNSAYLVDTTFNGYAYLDCIDSTGDTNSIYTNYSLDSIPIINGVGVLNISNNEAEYVYFNNGHCINTSTNDTIPLENRTLISQYCVSTSSDTDFVIEGDTLYFYIYDADSTLRNYNTIIDSIEIIEENANNSCNVFPLSNIPIYNGVGTIYISDSEVENIDIYGFYYDDLLKDHGVYKQFFSLSSYSGIIHNKSNLIPKINYLSPVYPNPFSNNIRILFGTPQMEKIRINIYDKNGRRIKTLLNKTLSPGNYIVKWNGKDENNNYVPDGVYFIYLHTENNFIKGQKVIFIK